jgi:hypothetical protein
VAGRNVIRSAAIVWDDDAMMIVIVGVCALLIGLGVGFAVGRLRPGKNAAVRRELRDIRAAAAPTKADTPNPYHTQGSGGFDPF